MKRTGNVEVYKEEEGLNLKTWSSAQFLLLPQLFSLCVTLKDSSKQASISHSTCTGDHKHLRVIIEFENLRKPSYDTLMVIDRGGRDGGIQITLKHSKRVPALQIQQQWPMMEPSNQYDVCCCCCWCQNETHNQTKSLKCVKEPNW